MNLSRPAGKYSLGKEFTTCFVARSCTCLKWRMKPEYISLQHGEISSEWARAGTRCVVLGSFQRRESLKGTSEKAMLIPTDSPDINK